MVARATVTASRVSVALERRLAEPAPDAERLAALELALQQARAQLDDREHT